MSDKKEKREAKNHKIEKKVLSELSLCEETEIRGFMKKLSEQQFVALFETIKNSIEFENTFLKEKKLSNSEIESELAFIKEQFGAARERIITLSKDRNLDERLDFFYTLGNENDEFMTKLSFSGNKNSKKRGEKELSGYTIMLSRMEKGIDAYINYLSPLKSKGRDKNYNYCHLILDLCEVFENPHFPYEISGNPDTVFFKLIHLIVKQNPKNLIKNAIDDKNNLRVSY